MTLMTMTLLPAVCASPALTTRWCNAWQSALWSTHPCRMEIRRGSSSWMPPLCSQWTSHSVCFCHQCRSGQNSVFVYLFRLHKCVFKAIFLFSTVCSSEAVLLKQFTVCFKKLLRKVCSLLKKKQYRWSLKTLHWINMFYVLSFSVSLNIMSARLQVCECSLFAWNVNCIVTNCIVTVKSPLHQTRLVHCCVLDQTVSFVVFYANWL